jgi:DNA-binding Xre family transcriptional regulator
MRKRQAHPRMLDITATITENRIVATRSRHVSEQLRRAVRKSDVSRYAICKAIGIDQATMSRFMSGERGLRLECIDQLCEFLNLELIARKPRQPKER